MDVSLLSNGAIKACNSGHGPPKPRFQVLSIKLIKAEKSGADRYRLQLSDGLHFLPGMLGTQYNSKVTSGEIDRMCVIQVEKMIVNTVQSRKIIVIINMSVLHKGSEVGGMLGKPTSLDSTSNTENDNRGFNSGNPPQQMMTHPPLGAQNQPRPPPVSYNQPRPLPVAQNPPRPQFNYQQSSSFGGGSDPSRQFYGNTANHGSYRGMSHGTPDSSPSSLSERKVVPITSLSPYQSKWTVKARITSKPNIRTYNNSRGEGRVMGVEMVDQSGEIRGTAFNEDADRLASIFQPNKVYYVSRGRIKPANKQFTTCNNDYEITFGQETQVEECLSNSSDVPSVTFNFTAIANLENVPKDTLVDVIGVCISTGELSSVTTRTTNRKVSKRDITLLDTSAKSISCTLWGSEAEGFDGSSHPIVAIKGVRVSEFNGVTLSVLGSSAVHYDPDITECHQLRGWYESCGKDQNVMSLSSQSSGMSSQTSFLSFRQIKELDLGRQDKPDYFSCKGMVIFLNKEKCLYKACPSAECNKKVTEDSTGRYFCEKCGQNYPNFQYRIITKLNCADFVDNCWMDCFNDAGAKILGLSGQELGELKEQDEAQFDNVIQESYFKEYIFRVRAKIDTYNDEQRLRCSCVDVQPLNYAQESKRLLEGINEMLSS